MVLCIQESEHSSFELMCFEMSCDWSRIIPTVNVGSEKVRLCGPKVGRQKGNEGRFSLSQEQQTTDDPVCDIL